MAARFGKGDRVESLRWPGFHGTVVRRDGEWLGVRWDGTSFTEDEAHTSEVKPSTRPALPDAGPGYLVVGGR
jgi:hypothetical protein